MNCINTTSTIMMMMMVMKTITIITSVSTFIRPRSALQSFPLAAALNGALVGSTCHMGGSRGGGEKGVLFLSANLSSISLPNPLLNLSSLSNVVYSGTRFALRLLYTLLLHAAQNCSKSYLLFLPPIFFKLSPTFSSFLNLKQIGFSAI